MAKYTHAIRKLQTWGAAITQTGQTAVGRKGHLVVTIYGQGSSDELCSAWVQRAWERDDPCSDYYAGQSFDNITAALKFADRIMEGDLADLREFVETGSVRHIPHEVMMRKALAITAATA